LIEEFALWLGCNAMHGNLELCAVNTLLIGPGVIGLSSVFMLYLMAIPILAWMGIRYFVRYMTDKLRGKQ
jgi:predicted membrane-bound spermidine synthase